MHTGYAETEDGWTYRNFFLKPFLLQQIAEQVCRSNILPYFPRPVIKDLEVYNLLLKAHITLEHSSVCLERETRLHDALTLLIQRNASIQKNQKKTIRNRPAVERVCDFIESNFAKNLSLDDLANIADLSKYHFLRVFRSEKGLSPHIYLLQVRTERAKQQLKAGKSITQVALNCGFCDQSHLTRHFKKIYGFTPGQVMARK